MDMQPSLKELYAEYIAKGDSPEIIQALEERAAQAICIYAVAAANMSDLEIADQIPRLEAAFNPRPFIDEAQDAAERETARVQYEVLQSELARREAFHEAVASGEFFAPTRAELIGSSIEVASTLRTDKKKTTQASAFVSKLLTLLEYHLDSNHAGIDVVVAVLRDVTSLPSPIPPTEEHAHEMTPWVQWAIALEFLSSRAGFAGIKGPEIDPITRAATEQAKTLFYAFSRQDPRRPGDTYLLDMPGDLIADVIEQASLARRYWEASGLPEADLLAYTTPVDREEAGRSKPHPQIVDKKAAQMSAQGRGGIIKPMLYPINPSLRQDAAKDIWENGIPPIREGELGIPLYGAPGDLRMQWDVQPHTQGLLCAVTLYPSQILSVGRKQDAEHEHALENFIAEAERSAQHPNDVQRILRERLIASGFKAIARYDHIYHETITPQELVVLDVSADVLLVIRQSVPSFVAETSIHRHR